MVEYECTRCGKIFNRKCNHKKHIERKNSCKNKLKIISINSNIKTETENILKINNNQQIIQNTSNDNLNNILNTLMIMSKEIELLKESNNELKESNNELKEKIKESNESNIDLKEKIKESNNELKEKIIESNIDLKEKIKESNNELKENNTKLNKKIISLEKKVIKIKPTKIKLINNNININITAFGKEDLNFITDELCKKIMYTGFDSVQNYVKLVHFNENKPEYQNIYISNKKNKNEIMVNDGNKWNIAKTNDIMEKLFFNSITFLKSNVDKLKDKLIESKIKGTKRLINDYDEDENKIIKDLSKDIILFIYNNRDKPIGNLISKT
jgi:DNA-directed RNA polymerase subunit RPC12/RpoP